MTVSWGGVGVLWGKNVVFIFIRDSRYTKEFLDNGDLFSLSFLNEDSRDALITAAVTVAAEKKTNSPLPD